MMLVMALSMVGCGDDDEKDDDNAEDGTVITTEYMATTEVKEVKLIAQSNYFTAYCVVYMDFMHKYVLNLQLGSLHLEPFDRAHGTWDWTPVHNSLPMLPHMKDLGKVNAITDIAEKVDFVGGYEAYRVTAQPQHGYAMSFKTENNEWKCLRVYIKGYTLDDKEALSSITVQYQLY